MHSSLRAYFFCFFIALGLLCAYGAKAQSALEITTWQTLADVKFERVYNDLIGGDYPTPTFGEKVKVLEGQTITLSGYVIPIDVEADLYVLSSNPYATCFFCGGAGPETVVELHFKKRPRRYKTDEILTVTGILKLNDSNVLQLNYILEEVVVVKD